MHSWYLISLADLWWVLVVLFPLRGKTSKTFTRNPAAVWCSLCRACMFAWLCRKGLWERLELTGLRMTRPCCQRKETKHQTKNPVATCRQSDKRQSICISSSPCRHSCTCSCISLCRRCHWLPSHQARCTCPFQPHEMLRSNSKPTSWSISLLALLLKQVFVLTCFDQFLP